MGKPDAQASHLDEYIVERERTRGSETSQYPEEKKSTEIPKVVASEIGRAQTGNVNQCRRTGWEAWRKRVKASYPKR